MNKYAKDVMTREVIYVYTKTSVYDAALKMVSNRISGVPVLNDVDDIVGVVTEKDLLVVLDFLGVHQAKDATIDECMSKDLITAYENTDLEEIARIFIQKNIKRVPIVKANKVIGIVSRHDVLKVIL